jgi:hypothetical protein
MQRVTSDPSESGCVTKRAIVASASSSIGHDSTAGELPARASSGSSNGPRTVPLPVFAARRQRLRLLTHLTERHHLRSDGARPCGSFDHFAGLAATENAGLRLESAAGVGSSHALPLGLLRFLLPLVVHTPVEEASRKVSRVRDQRERPGPS